MGMDGVSTHDSSDKLVKVLNSNQTLVSFLLLKLEHVISRFENEVFTVSIRNPTQRMLIQNGGKGLIRPSYNLISDVQLISKLQLRIEARLVSPQQINLRTRRDKSLITRVRQVRILGGQTVSRGVYQFRRTEAREEGPDGVGPFRGVDGGVPGPGEGVNLVYLSGPGQGVEGGGGAPHGGDRV